ncbi:MAG TPA: molybdopterin-guanine dinucleotide biosynthesis protein B, partial [Methanothrix sp.]|nr:molybdopterin-guanine dinucleotide biosynthesis protein B [Methanothrix sp.]
SDLQAEGMDFAVVEGFKHSNLQKIVMGDIEVSNCLRRVMLSDLNDALVNELTELVLGLEDYSA